MYKIVILRCRKKGGRWTYSTVLYTLQLYTPPLSFLSSHGHFCPNNMREDQRVLNCRDYTVNYVSTVGDKETMFYEIIELVKEL